MTNAPTNFFYNFDILDDLLLSGIGYRSVMRVMLTVLGCERRRSKGARAAGTTSSPESNLS